MPLARVYSGLRSLSTRTPRTPRMPRMPSRAVSQQAPAPQRQQESDSAHDQREDIRAQMDDALVRFLRDNDERNRMYGRSRDELGQSFAQRGLGWSGLRTGAEGRQLEDFTSEMGGAALEHQQQMDALQRQLRRIGSGG